MFLMDCSAMGWNAAASCASTDIAGTALGAILIFAGLIMIYIVLAKAFSEGEKHGSVGD